MPSYIATFVSHFGAMRFKRLCTSAGWPVKLGPVPRALSSSCGTCAQFGVPTAAHASPNAEHPWCPAATIPPEVEQVVEVQANTTGNASAQEPYRTIWIRPEDD